MKLINLNEQNRKASRTINSLIKTLVLDKYNAKDETVLDESSMSAYDQDIYDALCKSRSLLEQELRTQLKEARLQDIYDALCKSGSPLEQELNVIAKLNSKKI